MLIVNKDSIILVNFQELGRTWGKVGQAGEK